MKTSILLISISFLGACATNNKHDFALSKHEHENVEKIENRTDWLEEKVRKMESGYEKVISTLVSKGVFTEEEADQLRKEKD